VETLSIHKKCPEYFQKSTYFPQQVRTSYSPQWITCTWKKNDVLKKESDAVQDEEEQVFEVDSEDASSGPDYVIEEETEEDENTDQSNKGCVARRKDEACVNQKDPVKKGTCCMH
jgi:hypothetical protein